MWPELKRGFFLLDGHTILVVNPAVSWASWTLQCPLERSQGDDSKVFQWSFALESPGGMLPSVL